MLRSIAVFAYFCYTKDRKTGVYRTDYRVDTLHPQGAYKPPKVAPAESRRADGLEKSSPPDACFSISIVKIKGAFKAPFSVDGLHAQVPFLFLFEFSVQLGRSVLPDRDLLRNRPVPLVFQLHFVNARGKLEV